MRSKLEEDWFHRFKCTRSSEGSRPALGRLDPVTKLPLFTAETKVAWTNCKDKAEYLQDPLPVDQMYQTIPLNPNSPHKLNEYLSRWGESGLEAFHLLLAHHFANCGMHSSLADNLNLTGTARYNLGVQHKLNLMRRNMERCKVMPAAWEGVVPYFNHSQLHWVNELAVAAGVTEPFSNVEKLRKDTGEHFFSEYIVWLNETKPTFDSRDCCLCSDCRLQQSNENDSGDSVVVFCQPAATPSPTQISPTVTNTTVTNPAVPHQLPQNRQLPMPHPPTTQAPLFMPLYPPVMFMHTQMLFCCDIYRAWCNQPFRRGRPPHDHYKCRGFFPGVGVT
jgi:hypothetical protein